MARFDRKRKLERNAALIKYAHDNPDLSYQEIGNVFQISAQRVYAIIKQSGQGRFKQTVTA